MSEAILNFNNIEFKKSVVHKSKYPVNISEVDIDKIVISDKVLYGKKGFNTLLSKKMVR